MTNNATVMVCPMMIVYNQQCHCNGVSDDGSV